MTPKKLLIDCRREKTTVAVHAAIAHQLGFPEYYGANLDALHDALGDVLLEHAVVLRWRDTPASRANTELQAIKSVIRSLTV